MKAEKYKVTLSELHWQKYFHYMIIFALTAVIFLLSAKIFTIKETVVVLPPEFNEEIRVSSEKASSSYAKAWALFFSNMLGNVAPKTADFTADSVLKYMSVELQKKASSHIGRGVDIIQKNNITRIFTPSGIVYEPDTNKVFVSGKVTSIDSFGKKADGGLQTYEYIINIKNGYPKVSSFNAYEGRARTQEVLQRIKRLEEMKELKEGVQ